MPRIILKTPFIHHYEGSVFDLERSTPTPNWDFEDRTSPPRTYFLPDNGKGLAVDLPMSNTGICLPSIFKDIDLTTGPCRITSAQTKAHNETEVRADWQLKMEGVLLFTVKNSEKQGISIRVPTDSPHPQRLQIKERKENRIIKDISIDNYVLPLDFKDFTTGFYEIVVFCKNDIIHIVTFIKCFPLVVTLNRVTGEYTTMKTIW